MNEKEYQRLKKEVQKLKIKYFLYGVVSVVSIVVVLLVFYFKIKSAGLANWLDSAMM